jgi:acetyl esterase/lipase
LLSDWWQGLAYAFFYWSLTLIILSSGATIERSAFMSFTSRLFDLFLRLIAKPLLMFLSIEPDRLRKIQALDHKYAKRSKHPQGSRITDCELNTIPALIIQKDQDYQQEEGVILYLHGGAYCTGSPWAYKRLLWPLAKSTNVPIVAIDYRQSPDHVFPAALDDSICAYKALLDQGYAPETIFIMGDSAGGNLCLSTLLKIKQLQLPNPAAAVAMSPWADLSSSGDSIIDNARHDSYIPGFKRMDLVARLYAGNTPLNDPLLSPLFGDYSGLPPLKIIVGDIEVLLDDARRVADKAIAAGVEVDYKAWRGQCHVFPLFAFLPEAKQAQREIRAFVDKYKPAAVQAAA